MDKKILVEVNGGFIRKDSDVAGFQGEANVTIMNIIFDEGWDGYAKKITFWDALGENPVERTLTTDLLTDITVSTLDYSVPIPGEPLVHQGTMTFVIDGFADGVRKRSASDKLKVKYSPMADTAEEPADPTPTQAEQLQAQIDTMLGDMQAERILAEEAKNTAVNASEEAVVSAINAQTYELNTEIYATNAAESAEVAVKAKEDAEKAKNEVLDVVGGDVVSQSEFDAFFNNSFTPLSNDVSENKAKIEDINSDIDDINTGVEALQRAIEANATALGGKASQEDFFSHITDTEAHITNEERDKWNSVKGMLPQLVISCNVGDQIVVTDGITTIELVAEVEEVTVDIPNYGEWTVTIGTNTETLTIDTVKQYFVGGGKNHEQIVNYTMLYDEGDECTDVTGGWSADGYTFHSSVTTIAGTKSADHIYTKATSGAFSVAGTNNKISTVGYSKLHWEAASTGTSANHNVQICLSTAKANIETSLVAFWSQNNKEKTLMSNDIKQYQNEYYIPVFSNAESNREGKTYAVFLTKADDIRTLGDKAGVTVTSLDALLVDTTALVSIFDNEDAVRFMVQNCTGDFMVGVLNNVYNVALLKASPHLNTVIANPHWAKFIMMIPPAKELLNFTMLYDEGDECTDVTGGWNPYPYGTGSGTKTSPTVTKGDDKMTIVLKPSTCGSVYAENMINLDGYTNLYINASGWCQGDYSYFTLMTSPDKKVNLTHGDMLDFIQKGQTIPATLSYTPLTKGYTSAYVLIMSQIYNSGTNSTDVYNIFITKEDDITNLCTLAGISTPSDITTLVSDSTAMNLIMSNEDAVNYLMGCTGDLMVSICNSEVAMEALVNNIAYDYLFNHPVWYKFMTMCPVALSAMKSVAVSIPTMTSNTTPSGIASASKIQSGYDAYKAFDKIVDTFSNGGDNQTNLKMPWILQYSFENIIDIFNIELTYMGASNDGGVYEFELQISEDGIIYETVQTVSETSLSMSHGSKNINLILNEPKRVKFVRVNQTSGSNVSYPILCICICELQVYGKAVAE